MGLAETVVRGIAFCVGMVGVIAFFRSILRVAFLNRRSRDGYAAFVERGMRCVITSLARRQRDYRGVQTIMSWALPLYLFVLIAAWFALVQLSFTLMIWAAEAERGLFKAFISSGSALSTLGFDTPSSEAGQVLAIVEGAFGLGIIVFIFTFIPGYSDAVQSREEKVAWLYARTGPRPTVSSFIEWCQRAGRGDDLSPIWSDWEGWFTEIVETHTLTPILALVPSVHPERTWVGAAAEILDSTALCLTTLDVKWPESARLCHEAGLNTLRLVAAEFSATRSAAPTGATEDTASSFDASYNRLRAAGVALKPDRDECRRNFLELRSQYEHDIRRIAAAALMPTDQPWVLPRLGTEPIIPGRREPGRTRSSR